MSVFVGHLAFQWWGLTTMLQHRLDRVQERSTKVQRGHSHSHKMLRRPEKGNNQACTCMDGYISRRKEPSILWPRWTARRSALISQICNLIVSSVRLTIHQSAKPTDPLMATWRGLRVSRLRLKTSNNELTTMKMGIAPQKSVIPL